MAVTSAQCIGDALASQTAFGLQLSAGSAEVATFWPSVPGDDGIGVGCYEFFWYTNDNGVRQQLSKLKGPSQENFSLELRLDGNSLKPKWQTLGGVRLRPTINIAAGEIPNDRWMHMVVRGSTLATIELLIGKTDRDRTGGSGLGWDTFPYGVGANGGVYYDLSGDAGGNDFFMGPKGNRSTNDLGANAYLGTKDGTGGRAFAGGFCEWRIWKNERRTDANIVTYRDQLIDSASHPNLVHCFRLNEDTGTALASLADTGSESGLWSAYVASTQTVELGFGTHPFATAGTTYPVDGQVGMGMGAQATETATFAEAGQTGMGMGAQGVEVGTFAETAAAGMAHGAQAAETATFAETAAAGMGMGTEAIGVLGSQTYPVDGQVGMAHGAQATETATFAEAGQVGMGMAAEGLKATTLPESAAAGMGHAAQATQVPTFLEAAAAGMGMGAEAVETGTFVGAGQVGMAQGAQATETGTFTETAAAGMGMAAQATASVPTADAYRDLVMSHSPQFYWRLGESAGPTAADESGNGKTGTYKASGVLYGQASLTSSSDTSIWYGLTSYCKADATTTGDVTGSYSLVGWCDDGGTGIAKTIMMKDGAYSLSWGATGSLIFKKWLAASGSEQITGTHTKDFDRSHLVVATYSATNGMALYFDGHRIAVDATKTGAPATSANFFYSGGNGVSLSMTRCDDTAIIESELTAAEVEDLWVTGRQAPIVRQETGWVGATTEPASRGDNTDDYYTKHAIARWNVVPHQTLTADFDVGVVAFHHSGIDYVKIGMNAPDDDPDAVGSRWEKITSRSVNARTGKYEFWARVDVSYGTQGERELRAVAYPKNGKPYLLPSLNLYVDDLGTAPVTQMYISGTGNDTTGDGSSGNPFRTIVKARNEINATGDLDGGEILCFPGSYEFGAVSAPPQATNEQRWMTIKPEPGTTKSQVVITKGYSGGLKMSLVHVQGVTVTANEADLPIWTANQPSALMREIWLENVAHTGSSTTGINEWTHSGSTVFTDIWATGGCSFSTSRYALANATMVRDISGDNIGEDFLKNTPFVLDCTVTNIVWGSQGDHPDIYQLTGTGIHSQYLVVGLKATNCAAQGLFIDDVSDLNDSAFINCVIEHNGLNSQFSVGMDNVLLWGITDVTDTGNFNFNSGVGSFVRLSVRGCSFDKVIGSVDDATWSKSNHFVDPAVTFGTDTTTGSAGYVNEAADDYHPSGTSTLRDRLEQTITGATFYAAPGQIVIDQEGTVRAWPGDVGALEESAGPIAVSGEVGMGMGSQATETGTFGEAGQVGMGMGAQGVEATTLPEAAAAAMAMGAQGLGAVTFPEAAQAAMGHAATATEIATFAEAAQAGMGHAGSAGGTGTFAEAGQAAMGMGAQADGSVAGGNVYPVDGQAGMAHGAQALEVGTFAETAATGMGMGAQALEATTFAIAGAAGMGSGAGASAIRVVTVVAQTGMGMGAQATYTFTAVEATGAGMGHAAQAIEIGTFAEQVTAAMGMAAAGSLPAVVVPVEVREVLVSTLDVWNTALGELGVPYVQDENESSPQAKTLRVVWPIFRRKFIDDHAWNGCKMTRKLNRLTESPVDRWTYIYLLPYESLRVLTLNGEENTAGADKWEIEIDIPRQVRRLLTDANEAIVEYIADVPDVVTLAASTVHAMGVGLASHLARKFGKSAGEIRELRRSAEISLRMAKASDGMEGTPRIRSDTTLVDARF